MNSQGYIIIIEPTKTGLSAYCPDLPGCITVGETVEQTRKYMHEAIELYIEDLIEEGENVPKPRELKDQINIIGNIQSGTFMAFVPFQMVAHAKSA
jgi:predicted RNase H-like HicB family nuclease